MFVVKCIPKFKDELLGNTSGSPTFGFNGYEGPCGLMETAMRSIENSREQRKINQFHSKFQD